MDQGKNITRTKIQAKPKAGQERKVWKDLSCKKQAGDSSVSVENTLAYLNETTDTLVTSSKTLTTKDQADLGSAMGREIQILLSELSLELENVKEWEHIQYTKIQEDQQTLVDNVRAYFHQSLKPAIATVRNAGDQLNANWDNPDPDFQEKKLANLKHVCDEMRILDLELSLEQLKLKKQDIQQFSYIVEERLALGRGLNAFLQDRKFAIEGLRAAVKELIPYDTDCIDIGGMTSLDLAFAKLEMTRHSALNAETLNFEGFKHARKLGLEGFQAWTNSNSGNDSRLTAS